MEPRAPQQLPGAVDVGPIPYMQYGQALNGPNGIEVGGFRLQLSLVMWAAYAQQWQLCAMRLFGKG